jgi:hypothetical protein
MPRAEAEKARRKRAEEEYKKRLKYRIYGYSTLHRQAKKAFHHKGIYPLS